MVLDNDSIRNEKSGNPKLLGDSARKKFSKTPKRLGFDLNNPLQVAQYAAKKHASDGTPKRVNATLHSSPTTSSTLTTFNMPCASSAGLDVTASSSESEECGSTRNTASTSKFALSNSFGSHETSTGDHSISSRSRRFGFDLNNRLQVVHYANRRGGSADVLKHLASTTTSMGSPSFSSSAVKFIPPSAPSSTAEAQTTTDMAAPLSADGGDEVADVGKSAKNSADSSSFVSSGLIVEKGDNIGESTTAAENIFTQPVKAKKRCVTWKRLSDGGKD